jgi:hypothetical protein
MIKDVELRGKRMVGRYDSERLAQRRLFIITDTFTVTGRGLVLVPGLIPIGDERFKAGDPILLRAPDGQETRTSIATLELPHPNPRNEVLIMLRDLGKDDVPVGTEVWSV